MDGKRCCSCHEVRPLFDAACAAGEGRRRRGAARAAGSGTRRTGRGTASTPAAGPSRSGGSTGGGSVSTCPSTRASTAGEPTSASWSSTTREHGRPGGARRARPPLCSCRPRRPSRRVTRAGDGGGVRLYAHRGSPGPSTVENTLPAVAACLLDGADGVEVDLRLSADGVLVALPRRDPAPDGRRAAGRRHQPWDELQDAGRRAGVPLARVEEVLAALAGRPVVLEVKRRCPAPCPPRSRPSWRVLAARCRPACSSTSPCRRFAPRSCARCAARLRPSSACARRCSATCGTGRRRLLRHGAAGRPRRGAPARRGAARASRPRSAGARARRRGRPVDGEPGPGAAPAGRARRRRRASPTCRLGPAGPGRRTPRRRLTRPGHPHGPVTCRTPARPPWASRRPPLPDAEDPVRLRLTPRDTVFYDQFAVSARNIVDAAEVLEQIVAPGADRGRSTPACATSSTPTTRTPTR